MTFFTWGLLGGLIAFGDTLIPSVTAAVQRLRGIGVSSVMLTGDNPGSARTVASAVGISDFRAQVLPADKAKVVAALKKGGKTVAMVGDGINDAPHWRRRTSVSQCRSVQMSRCMPG